MPWLGTGMESGTSNFSCRYALARYMCRIYNQSLTDMPWLGTGIESGTSNSSCRYALARYRYRIHNQSLTDMPWLDTGIESVTATVDSNHLWIDLFPEKAKHQSYAMS